MVEQLETRVTPALLVATSFFDSAVYEFDANTGALAATLVAPYSSSLLSGPAGLTVGPDGNLYISSQFNDSILEYNRSTSTLSTFISSDVLTPIATTIGAPSFAPAGLRFGPDGNLYVDLNGGQSSTTGAVVRFDIIAGTFTGSDTIVTTAGLVQPSGLAFGPAGDSTSLYVSSSGTDTVVKIADATGASPTASTFITGGGSDTDYMNFPSGLTWGPDGKLYVADLGATSFQGNVLRFNADGSFDEVYAQPNGGGQGNLLFQFPSDLVFDTQGRLDTANLGSSYPPSLDGSINQYDSTGVFATPLVSSGQFPNTGPSTSGISPSQLALLASPTITSANSTTFTEDAAGSFSVTASGNPASSFSETGALPPGVTFSAAGVLSGTPTQTGSFPIVITANNTVGPNVTQNFTLTVDPGLFATSFFDSAVYEFDANTGSLAATLVTPYTSALLSGPAGLTIGPDGNLYISSEFNDSILEYNLSTNTLSTFISSGVLTPIATTIGAPSFAPAGLRFGPDGNLYVDLNGGQSSTTGAVVRFDISAGAFTGTDTIVTTAGLVQPSGLTFGPTGDTTSLYVSSSGTDTVVKIADATGASPVASTFITGGGADTDYMNYPSGLTWGPDGKLYVADLGATSFQGNVLRFNSDGSFDEVYAQPNGGGQGSLLFQFPSDLVFDAQGQLDTANLGSAYPPNLDGSINQYDSTGVFATPLVSSGQFPNTGPSTSGISPSQLALLPTITSANSTTFTVDAAGSFTVIASGNPTSSFSETGALPTGVTLTSAGVLGGTPTETGTFPIVITANNTLGPNVTQNFTLTVDPGLFATSFFDSAVYEFDANTGALAATLVTPYTSALLSGPAGLTIGPDGNLYISSQFNDSILEYNLSTNTLSTFISSDVLTPIATTIGAPSFAPAALRFGPDGNLYVDLNGGQSSTTGAVVRFDITAGTFTGTDTIVTTAGLVQPSGLTFGPAGDSTSLYVSSPGTDTVVKIADATGPSPTASTFITGGPDTGNMNFPSGLTWGPDGKLYVVDLGATSFQGNVLRFNADGSFDEVYAQPNGGGQGNLLFQFPSDLVFDAQGRLDTANLGAEYPPALGGLINQYDSSGVFASTLVSSDQFPNTGPSTSGISPSQLALLASPTITSANNTTFTVDAAGSFSVSATGSPTSSFSETGALPRGVTFSTTGVLSGTPTEIGSFPIIITANNTVGPNATQNFTLTVDPGLFATSFFDSAVYEFDANSGALAATLVAPYTSALLSGPAGLTVGPDGNLYISSQFNDSILEYNLSTNTLSTFISSDVLTPIATTIGAPSFAPAALRFGPDGNLYVDLNGGQSSTTGAVVRFDITAGTFTGTDTIVTTAGLVQPSGLTFGPAGDSTSLYVSSPGTDTVVKIADATGPSPTASTFITGGPDTGNMNFPSGLTWGPDGKLYVADLGATSFQGNILRFNADGSFDEVYAQPNGGGQGSLLFQFPSDLVFDSQGRLDTANLGSSYPPNLDGSINQYDSSGVFATTLVSSDQFPNTGPGTSGISPSQLALFAPPSSTTVNLLDVDINSDAANAAIYDGGVQRSMVDSVVYHFNTPVNLDNSAIVITLHNGVTVTLGNGTQVVNGGTYGTVPDASTWSTPDNGYTWVVAFGGDGVLNGGSIADGIYDITLYAAHITTASGGAVTLNAYNGGNGGVGNDTETFWCLFGDANGTKKVTTQDFSSFAQSYLQRSTQPNYVAWFDLNANNKVTTQDYSVFANNYLKRYSGFTATI